MPVRWGIYRQPVSVETNVGPLHHFRRRGGADNNNNVSHQMRACGYSQSLVLRDLDLSKSGQAGVDTTDRCGIIGDRSS